MAYVIAEPCIGTKDTACVDACPVDCIHPKKDSEKFAGRRDDLHRSGGVHRLRRVRARCVRFRRFSRSTICRKNGRNTPSATPNISAAKRGRRHKGTPAGVPFFFAADVQTSLFDLLDQHLGRIALGDKGIRQFQGVRAAARNRPREKMMGTSDAAAAHLRGHVSAVQTRHVIVEHHHVYLVLLEQLQSLLSVAGGQHAEALAFQHDLADAQSDFLIVNAQYCLRADSCASSSTFVSSAFRFPTSRRLPKPSLCAS